MKKGSSSFLKKRSKKLLFVWSGNSDRRSAWGKVSKVFLLNLSAGILAASLSAHAQICTLALSAQLPLRPGPLIEARINNQPALLQFDTGAFTTTLTPQAVKRLHLHEDLDRSESFRGTLDGPLPIAGIGGERIVKVAMTNSFELGAIHGRMHFMSAELGSSDTDGLLSTDFLQKYDIDLDFAGQQIRIFQASGSCDRPKVLLQPPLYVVPLLYNEEDPSPRIHVVINGHSLRALIDTGADSTVIFQHAAEQMGLSPSDLAHDRHQHVRGIGPGEVDAIKHVFDTVSVGDLTVRNMPIEIIDNPRFDNTDVLLGVDFQRKIHLWISNSAHALVLQYPPQASPPTTK